jgi:beta-lactam-binding protein with PASTA domain
MFMGKAKYFILLFIVVFAAALFGVNYWVTSTKYTDTSKKALLSLSDAKIKSSQNAELEIKIFTVEINLKYQLPKQGEV